LSFTYKLNCRNRAAAEEFDGRGVAADRLKEMPNPMTDPLKLRARTSAPLATVRHALTDASALRIWLAEHAVVELPDTFSFWGRYTPEGAEPGQRPLYVDGRTFRFGWQLSGVDTTVEFVLTEESGSTIIDLSQSHVPDWSEVMNDTTVPLAVLGTFWSLAIANLVDHVEGRETSPKCDFTSPVLREQVTVGASPGEVYQSLMDPERFRRWFGVNMRVEPHVGGRWAMGDSFDDPNSVARITELEPQRRVVLDWGGMVSTWELAGSDGQTRLTFVNSGFDEDNPPYADWTGWLGGLAALRRFHELPEFRSIWLASEWPGMGDGMLATR
jgi:uncharacterized protein YndB with AHSA1/START domain